MDTIYQLYGTSNNLLFTEESILKYCDGGYHPVALGDVFAFGRYIVHHKLGYGGFSTVWLARDTRTERWVALKILTAEQTKRSAEVDVLRKMPLRRNIVKLLDHFEHSGPNGRHSCLILELLGPTLNTVLPDFYAEDVDCDITWVRNMAEQLLDAVTCIHSAGYSHGDLSPRNLAFSCGRMPTLSEADLFKLLGEPQTEAVIRVDDEEVALSIPKEMVRSTTWPGWPDADLYDELQDEILDSRCSDYSDDEQYHNEIVIMDLGEAFNKSSTLEILAQPGGLQAPESIFEVTVDYKADLWRIGLIIYYLLHGAMPFHWHDLNQLVASMIEFAGSLPEAWVPKWKAMAENSRNEFVRDVATREDLAGSILRAKIEAARGDRDRTILLALVHGLAKLEPSSRMSSGEALMKLGRTDVPLADAGF